MLPNRRSPQTGITTAANADVPPHPVTPPGALVTSPGRDSRRSLTRGPFANGPGRVFPASHDESKVDEGGGRNTTLAGGQVKTVTPSSHRPSPLGRSQAQLDQLLSDLILEISSANDDGSPNDDGESELATHGGTQFPARSPPTAPAGYSKLDSVGSTREANEDDDDDNLPSANMEEFSGDLDAIFDTKFKLAIPATEEKSPPAVPTQLDQLETLPPSNWPDFPPAEAPRRAPSTGSTSTFSIETFNRRAEGLGPLPSPLPPTTETPTSSIANQDPLSHDDFDSILTGKTAFEGGEQQDAIRFEDFDLWDLSKLSIGERDEVTELLTAPVPRGGRPEARLSVLLRPASPAGDGAKSSAGSSDEPLWELALLGKESTTVDPMDVHLGGPSSPTSPQSQVSSSTVPVQLEQNVQRWQSLPLPVQAQQQSEPLATNLSRENTFRERIRGKTPSPTRSPLSRSSQTPSPSSPVILPSSAVAPKVRSGGRPLPPALDSNSISEAVRVAQALNRLREARIQKVMTRIYINDSQAFKTLCLNSLMDCEQVTREAVEKSNLEAIYASNPVKNDWALFEVFSDLEVERPIKDWEIVTDLLRTWGRQTRNALLLRRYGYKPSLTISSLKTFFPEVRAWLYLEVKRGQFKRKWFELRLGDESHSIPAAANAPMGTTATSIAGGTGGYADAGASEGGSVGSGPAPFTSVASVHYATQAPNGKEPTTLLCSLADYDVYTPVRQRKRAPTRFCFALKAQAPMVEYDQMEGSYIHFFYADTAEIMKQWVLALRNARSHVDMHLRPGLLAEATRKERAAVAAASAQSSPLPPPIPSRGGTSTPMRSAPASPPGAGGGIGSGKPPTTTESFAARRDRAASPSRGTATGPIATTPSLLAQIDTRKEVLSSAAGSASALQQPATGTKRPLIDLIPGRHDQ